MEILEIKQKMKERNEQFKQFVAEQRQNKTQNDQVEPCIWWYELICTNPPPSQDQNKLSNSNKEPRIKISVGEEKQVFLVERKILMQCGWFQKFYSLKSKCMIFSVLT